MITANIYRPKYGSCSNYGLSHFYDVVVIKDTKGPFEEGETKPEVRLVKSNGYIYAVPTRAPKGLIGPMFGGCFIYSSDSRFPSQYPIPLHDRFETEEENEILRK